MKILLLANHFNAGSITTCLLTLGKEYIRRGHQVYMATSGGGCVADAQSAGIVHLTVPGLGVKCECHPCLVMAVARVAHYVHDEGIDILHAHTRVTQIVSAAAGLFARRPYVSTCHGFFKPRLLRLLLPLWGRGVIAISRSVAEHLVLDLKVARDRVVFIRNGIDPVRFNPLPMAECLKIRKCLGLEAGVPMTGTIARLSDVKGLAYLVKAMDLLRYRIPGVRCLVAGEGPMEEDLKSLVRTLGLETTVIFMRMTGRPEALLPVFDVFAMPSLQEGLGLSAMEAAACGIPVVASRVGGLVEAVNDGITGFLVPARDHRALADALELLLLDKALAQRLGCAGRARIMAEFSADVMAGKTLEVYGKAITAHA